MRLSLNRKHNSALHNDYHVAAAGVLEQSWHRSREAAAASVLICYGVG